MRCITWHGRPKQRSALHWKALPRLSKPDALLADSRTFLPQAEPRYHTHLLQALGQINSYKVNCADAPDELHCPHQVHCGAESNLQTTRFTLDRPHLSSSCVESPSLRLNCPWYNISRDVWQSLAPTPVLILPLFARRLRVSSQTASAGCTVVWLPSQSSSCPKVARRLGVSSQRASPTYTNP